MKRTFALALALILLMSIVHTPALAAGENADGKAWTYDNSLIVTVNVAEEKTFTPEDFPEVEVEEVLVTYKSPTKTGYNYSLVVVLDDTVKEPDIESATKSISSLSFVTDVKRNCYTYDYVDKNTVIELSVSELFLAVGERAEVEVKRLQTVTDSVVYNAVLFSVDKDILADEALETELEKYGIYEYGTFDNAPDYTTVITDLFDSEIIDSENIYYGYAEALVDVPSRKDYYTYSYCANNLCGVNGITAVTILAEILPTGLRDYELWSVTDESILGLDVSGGEYIGASTTPIGQTATVTANKTGVAYLKANCAKDGGIANADCAVYVYMIGDVTGDGKINSHDAAFILQYDADIRDFDDLAIAAADYNGDGKVTSLDAALILRFDAGL